MGFPWSQENVIVLTVEMLHALLAIFLLFLAVPKNYKHKCSEQGRSAEDLSQILPVVNANENGTIITPRKYIKLALQFTQNW